MSQREKFNNKKLSNDLDPDFDLDGFIDEQSEDQNEPEFTDRSDDPSYRIKNSLLVVTAITALFLWYFDWSPTNAYAFFFGSNESSVVVQSRPANIQLPELPELPELPNIPDINTGGAISSGLEMPITDYLIELRDNNLLGDDKLSTFEARQLYDANVPIEYIQLIENQGWLDHFSFVQITEFYRTDIPMEYLKSLEQQGYLFDFSFPAVTEYYRNGVTFEYLESLDNAGYLDELSFVHVTAYFQNGVTPEYLDKLKETGLYDDLSFIDVVDLYNRENSN